MIILKETKLNNTNSIFKNYYTISWFENKISDQNGYL